MSKQEDAAYITPPLENSDAMKCIANVLTSTAGTTHSLTGLFGAGYGDAYLTLQSDGAKIYVKFAGNAQRAGDVGTTGTGSAVMWPIPDGVSMSVFPTWGREVGTGIGLTAGICTNVRYETLHLKVASGGVATAYMRLYRNVAPGKDGGSLKAP